MSRKAPSVASVTRMAQGSVTPARIRKPRPARSMRSHPALRCQIDRAATVVSARSGATGPLTRIAAAIGSHTQR